MKHLLAALLTILPALSHAGELQVNVLAFARVDLDQDGKEDYVRVVERESRKLPGVFERSIEVHLSQAKQNFVFGNILKTVSYQEEKQCRPTDSAERYASTTPISLRASKAGRFLLTEGGADYDGCNNIMENSWQVGVWDGRLVVEKATQIFHHGGMGDSKYHSEFSFNFMNKTAASDILDYSDAENEGVKKWRMPNSCNLTLQGLSERGIPKCAYRKAP